MTTKVNAQDVVRKQIELWNRHDAQSIAAGYTPDVRVIDPYYPEPLSGRDAVQKDAADFFVAFPDLVFRIASIMADGDSVALEGNASGTHTGPLQLPTGLIPATNKRLEFNWAVFLSLDEAGSIREERRYYDVASQMAQLGLMQ